MHAMKNKSTSKLYDRKKIWCEKLI